MSDLETLVEVLAGPVPSIEKAEMLFALAPFLIEVAMYASSIECESSGEYYKCCGECLGDPHMSDCPVPALFAKLTEVLP